MLFTNASKWLHFNLVCFSTLLQIYCKWRRKKTQKYKSFKKDWCLFSNDKIKCIWIIYHVSSCRVKWDCMLIYISVLFRILFKDVHIIQGNISVSYLQSTEEPCYDEHLFSYQAVQITFHTPPKETCALYRTKLNKDKCSELSLMQHKMKKIPQNIIPLFKKWYMYFDLTHLAISHVHKCNIANCLRDT